MRRIYPWAVIVLVCGFWQALSWLPQGRDVAHSLLNNSPSTASAPSVAWMPTLVPTPTPTATARPTATPQPSPTALPTATPAPTLSPELALLAQQNGFDPHGDFIVVNQNIQRMHVVLQGVEVRTLRVTTGNPETGEHTPAWVGTVGDYWGTFLGRGNVFADHGWWLFDGPGGNFLIHGLPYLVNAQGEKVYKDAEILGVYPASSGCIRLSVEDSEWFTQLQPKGMPIVILPYDGGTARQG